MLIAVIVTMIDAVGNVYACATIAEAPPLPGNVVNRGIFMQGVCCMLAGLWGTGNGTTTASDSMSIIGITKVKQYTIIQSYFKGHYVSETLSFFPVKSFVFVSYYSFQKVLVAIYRNFFGFFCSLSRWYNFSDFYGSQNTTLLTFCYI
jgi:hypothetical protein